MECHYFLPILGYTPQEKTIKEPIIAAAQLGVPSMHFWIIHSVHK